MIVQIFVNGYQVVFISIYPFHIMCPACASLSCVNGVYMFVFKLVVFCIHSYKGREKCVLTVCDTKRKSYGIPIQKFQGIESPTHTASDKTMWQEQVGSFIYFVCWEVPFSELCCPVIQIATESYYFCPFMPIYTFNKLFYPPPLSSHRHLQTWHIHPLLPPILNF